MSKPTLIAPATFTRLRQDTLQIAMKLEHPHIFRGISLLRTPFWGTLSLLGTPLPFGGHFPF